MGILLLEMLISTEINSAGNMLTREIGERGSKVI